MSRRPRASDDTEPGLLKRWSKRKARSGEAGDAAAPAVGDYPETVDEPGVEAPRTGDGAPDAETQERVKTDEDMPDLDSINETSDLRDFFSPGVSEQLRNQALRRLFRTSRFNVIDPLDDYNEDFRNFELLGDLVTSDMRHRIEMDEQRRKEAEQVVDASRDGEPTAAASVEDNEGADDDSEETAADRRRAEEAADADDDESFTDSDTAPRTRT